MYETKDFGNFPGFAAQGMHRIHYVARPRPHPIIKTYSPSVEHRVCSQNVTSKEKYDTITGINIKYCDYISKNSYQRLN